MWENWNFRTAESHHQNFGAGWPFELSSYRQEEYSPGNRSDLLSTAAPNSRSGLMRVSLGSCPGIPSSRPRQDNLPSNTSCGANWRVEAGQPGWDGEGECLVWTGRPPRSGRTSTSKLSKTTERCQEALSCFPASSPASLGIPFPPTSSNSTTAEPQHPPR